MTLTVGSLFSGVGGFDIAAENVGMKVLWQSETDKFASKMLDHHWKDLNLGDIHDIRIRQDELETQQGDLTNSEGRKALGGFHRDSRGTHDEQRIARPVDLLAGGFPCQSYSVAGNRGGLAEDRGALWWEFHRLIREGQPTWVLGENVPGLLSSAGGRDFATIIRSLVQLGYGVVWRVLDAQNFGVPQRRRRVFIVGHIGGIPRPEVLALSEGMSGDPSSSRRARKSATTITGNSARGGGRSDDSTAQANHLIAYRQQRTTDYVEDDLASTLKQRDHKDATDLIAFTQNQRNEIRDLHDRAGALAAEPGMKQQTYIAYNVYPSGHGQGKELTAKETDLSMTIPSVNGHHDRGTRIVDSRSVRRLTPLECQRLQGFPDDFYDGIKMSDTQKYRQMGNAVAVPVVEWIMERIAYIDAT